MSTHRAACLSVECDDIHPLIKIVIIAIYLSKPGSSDPLLGHSSSSSRRFSITLYFTLSCTVRLNCTLLLSAMLGAHHIPFLYSPPYPCFSNAISTTISFWLKRGDTTYMTCVSVMTPAWIPMLARDSPLLHWYACIQFYYRAHEMLHHDTSCHVMSCHVIPYDLMLCSAMRCCVVPCCAC